MKRHQLTNETKQTGFQAGFFPGLIGINCERLQSTARRLTFASSERFLLIVLMITTGAGDHRQAGNGAAWCLAWDPARGLASLCLPRSQGSHCPLLPVAGELHQVPGLGALGTGPPAGGLAAGLQS